MVSSLNKKSEKGDKDYSAFTVLVHKHLTATLLLHSNILLP